MTAPVNTYEKNDLDKLISYLQGLRVEIDKSEKKKKSIKKVKKVKFQCKCGSVILNNSSAIRRHERTKLHQAYVEE